MYQCENEKKKKKEKKQKEEKRGGRGGRVEVMIFLQDMKRRVKAREKNFYDE